MAFEIERPPGLAVPGEIGGRRAGWDTRLEQLAGDECGWLGLAEPHRHVDTFPDEITQRVAHHDFQRHRWVGREEGRQAGRLNRANQGSAFARSRPRGEAAELATSVAASSSRVSSGTTWARKRRPSVGERDSYAELLTLL
jgi:hypothetical protein